MKSSLPQSIDEYRDVEEPAKTSVEIKPNEADAVFKALQRFRDGQQDLAKTAGNPNYPEYAKARAEVGQILIDKFPSGGGSLELSSWIDAYELYVAMTHRVDKKIRDDTKPEAKTLNTVIDRLESDGEYGDRLRNKDRFVATDGTENPDYEKREGR